MTELDTRSRILAAARVQVAAGGAAALRIDSVARAAGVNKRMIYHWFGHREGLVRAAFGPDASRDVESDEAIRLLAWQALEGRLEEPMLADMLADIQPLPGSVNPAARDEAARALALRYGLALFGPVIERAVGLEPQPWRERLAGWMDPQEGRVAKGNRQGSAGARTSLASPEGSGSSARPARREGANASADASAPQVSAPAVRVRAPKPRVRVQPRLRPRT